MDPPALSFLQQLEEALHQEIAFCEEYRLSSSALLVFSCKNAKMWCESARKSPNTYFKRMHLRGKNFPVS